VIEPITSISKSHFVNKPWGHEIWIAPGNPSFPYVLKEIKINTGFKSSLQFHVKKQETNLVLSGLGRLEYSEKLIDVNRYELGDWSQLEMDKVLSTLKFINLKKGSVFHMFPGMIHRVHSDDNLLMNECSSLEVDDVIRIQYDSGRGSGRIQSEHGV